MNKHSSLFPEPESLLPLLSLVPRVGGINELTRYSTALFARHEQVSRAREEASESDTQRRLALEEGMLAVVLEWLRNNPSTR